MKMLRRVSRGGFLAAFVYLQIYASASCATGAEDGTEGVADGDAGADGSGKQDANVVPGKDSGSSKTDGGGGDDDGGACDGKVVINEVMTRGGTASEEFVELYNPGGCAVPLGGWKLAYRSSGGAAGPVLHTFVSGAAIPAKAFFVLGTTAFGGKKDAVMNDGMADDGQVALQDDQGKTVDAVGYGTATGAFVEGSAAPSPDASGSIARKSDGVDTNDNAADFAKTKPHSAGAPNP